MSVSSVQAGSTRQNVLFAAAKAPLCHRDWELPPNWPETYTADIVEYDGDVGQSWKRISLTKITHLFFIQNNKAITAAINEAYQVSVLDDCLEVIQVCVRDQLIPLEPQASPKRETPPSSRARAP